MLHQRPTTALVVGLGGGATPGALARMNVHVDVVELSRAVVAGSDGENPPTTGLAQQPSWPNPTVEPWYVIQAGGDHDNDQSLSFFVSSSFAPTEIFSQNDAE